ncbi:MAG: hypothetical protein LBT14_09000 [Treponema sp.]|nr:hypothetical protein [Treponema sp.]
MIWADGSFYVGGFNEGFAHGDGILVNYSGYIAGRWNMGNFIGVNNNFSDNDFKRTLQKNDFVADGERYNTETIDPGSPGGRSLLGRLK